MEKPKVEDKSVVNFETALAMTGHGKFQYSMVLMAGSIFLCVGNENGLNSYIMPAAQCDLKMTSEDKGHLNVAFLTGGILSAYFWGILADKVGRKIVLVTSLMLCGFATLIASFSQSFVLLTVLRFISGFLIGGPGSIIFSYAGEFIAERERVKCVCFVGSFITISWMLLPLVAMGVLPLTFRIETSGFLFNSWRLYTILLAVPTITASFLLLFCFPESPKFLYSQGREREALKVMAKMYYSNYGCRRDSYPVQKILSNSRTEKAIDTNRIVKKGKSVSAIIIDAFKQICSIYKPPYLCATALSGGLFFCNLFGYLGLAVWLPELFDRFDFHYKTSNISVTVCELTRLVKNHSSDIFLEDPYEGSDIFCQNTVKEPAVFVNTFIIGTCCWFGNICFSLLANVIGLRVLTVITMGVSGVSAFLLYFLSSSWQILVVSCFFVTFVVGGTAVIDTVTCELFPTEVRSLGACAANFKGRLGAVCCNLVMGYTLDTNCELPVFLMASVIMFGSALGFLLPRNGTAAVWPPCEVKQVSHFSRTISEGEYLQQTEFVLSETNPFIEQKC